MSAVTALSIYQTSGLIYLPSYSNMREGKKKGRSKQISGMENYTNHHWQEAEKTEISGNSCPCNAEWRLPQRRTGFSPLHDDTETCCTATALTWTGTLIRAVSRLRRCSHVEEILITCKQINTKGRTGSAILVLLLSL